MHPMYRDGHQRRKMGPVIVNKNSSQDRLIEELQGKFGIGRSERRRKNDDWLTEGVIIMSKPQRSRPDGPDADGNVDKVGFSRFPKIILEVCFLHVSCFSLLFLRSFSPRSRLSLRGRCSRLSLPPLLVALPL